MIYYLSDNDQYDHYLHMFLFRDAKVSRKAVTQISHLRIAYNSRLYDSA